MSISQTILVQSHEKSVHSHVAVPDSFAKQEGIVPLSRVVTMGHIVIERYEIRGAMCPHCVATVVRALEQLDGVDQVQSTVQPPSVEIHYNPEKLTAEQLKQAVEQIHFTLVTQ